MNNSEFRRHPGLDFLLSFGLDGGQHPVSDMFTYWIIEHLNVVEHVLPCLITGSVGFSSDTLAFKQIEGTLCYGIVVAVPALAYCILEIITF